MAIQSKLSCLEPASGAGDITVGGIEGAYAGRYPSPPPEHIPLPSFLDGEKSYGQSYSNWQEKSYGQSYGNCDSPAWRPMPSQVGCQWSWQETQALKQAVRSLVREAAQVLLQVPDRSLPLAELYLLLGVDVTGFMHEHGLWLSDVFECYLDHFDCKPLAGRLTVTYFHSAIPTHFVTSQISRLVSL
eukprot:TRINITY_DN23040_c0_g1_i1.p1 TRINITY_DN23040_c0_g1~~TRINITY_DN23040_c0_g1_i1.p1  ORF type:complete len:187 (-),score=16.45 TRINITY_DN23040_c0_g1_i1:458-1018(-)